MNAPRIAAAAALLLSLTTARAQEAAPPAPAAPPAEPTPAAAPAPAPAPVLPPAIPAAAAAPAAKADAGVKVGGFLHVDGRSFLGDDDVRLTNELLIRRARLDLQAKLGRFSARFVPDFGGGKAVVQDAYVDAKLPAGLSLRAGKFTPPISAERLQSSNAYYFVETALSSNLAPTRDVGLQLSGTVGKLAAFSVGLFDGAPDGGAVDGDAGDPKEFAARVFVKPFATLGIDLLANLGVGVSGSFGRTAGDPTKVTELSGYKTDGQATLFDFKKWKAGASYSQPSAADTAWGSGRRARLGVQASWFGGPAGIVGEYLVSQQDVALGAPETSARLTNRGWQAVALYNVTGEKGSDGVVTPGSPVDGGGWGALQVAVRVSRLDVDPDAFPTYAKPEKSVERATAVGVGLNWWPTAGARLQVDYSQTAFVGGAGTSTAVEDLASEKVLLARAQVAF
jgi:phosphate-selective porin OprO/OprP